MTIQVQTYLLTHSLAQLKTELGIKSSAKTGDYLFSLNYDQVESKPGPIVNQCRGVVLATPDGTPLQDAQILGDAPVGFTVVLARPFDRFFNFGDSHAAQVDFNDPETVFFEKLDGTLCILYHDPFANEWNVATRAVPKADKRITGWDDWTFRRLFEKALYHTVTRDVWLFGGVSKIVESNDPEAWKRAFRRTTKDLDPNHTYIYELTTPLNRIVVGYETYRIHLLGVRDRTTGVEIDPGDSPFVGIDLCPSHKLSNQQELLEFVGSKPPFEQEGIVVRDRHFNRVKVKSLAYMAYNRLRDSTANSPRAVMELILSEKLDDVFPVLENYIQKMATVMQDQTRRLFQKVEQDYASIMLTMNTPEAQENPRKAFALAVQAHKTMMAPMMDRYLGKSKDFNDWIQKRRGVDGSYPDGLLDTLIAESKKLE